MKPFANVMGLVISVVCYLQADIPVIMHLRHLSVSRYSVKWVWGPTVKCGLDSRTRGLTDSS